MIKDGDYIIQELKVVFTPGHTPGHISFLLEDNHALIAGDVVTVENSKFVIANPEFTLDFETCMDSVKKILGLASKKVICYHGGIIEGNIDDLLNEISLNQGE